MKIYAMAIEHGKVIEHTLAMATIRAENVTYEQVGMVVMDCISKARALQFHMLAPDMSIKVEFKPHD